jgi:hypothetical protein
LAERLRLEEFRNMLRANLACIAQFRGDSAHALTMWRQAVSDMDDLLLHQGEDAGLYALAEGEHGELAVGLHLAEDFALRLMARPHDVLHATSMFPVLAHFRLAAGDLDGAEAALEVVDRAARPRVGFAEGLVIVTRSALWRHRNQPHIAAATLEQACTRLRYRGTTDITMRVLEELAAVAFALGQRDDSANLLATAQRARQDDEKALSPLCRASVETLQTRLGDRHGMLLGPADVQELAQSLANKAPREL